MFRIKVWYRSGRSDVMECSEDAAKQAVSAATQRMAAGLDGIVNVTVWAV